MDLLVTVIGLVIILIALWDIFETLFNPEDQGYVTDLVVRCVWEMNRALSTQRKMWLSYAGPIAYVSVLLTWASLLTFGWTAVYWAHMPEAFSFEIDVDPEQVGVVEALYLSIVTVATLGYGDITPTVGWLRILAPLQALAGFLLLSGALTWILSIYRDLETRRSLAHETSLLRESLQETGISIDQLEAASIERMLGQLSGRIVTVTGSLVQFPITYTFRTQEERRSLAAMALFLFSITQDLQREDLPLGVQLNAVLLNRALDDLAASLSSRFLEVEDDASTLDILEAYAEDHMRLAGTSLARELMRS